MDGIPQLEILVEILRQNGNVFPFQFHLPLPLSRAGILNPPGLPHV
jgi:hypothetical protein